MQADLFMPCGRAKITPREYQLKDHDESFRQWNAGTVGTLTRAATGTGKTLMSCLKMDTWLARGQNQRCMVVSYETQLVWQFAQEIEDFLEIRPGIEMDSEKVDPDDIPKIVVASRQSLLRHQPPDPEQLAELKAFGINDVGPASKGMCISFIRALKKAREQAEAWEARDPILAKIEEMKHSPLADGNNWARLHKFDWHLNWLLVFDEAHRHAHKLVSVGHIVDWFERNPEHRRSGITATPKRGDGVSIGTKMFPGIALDYPLYSPRKACAVRDGWAVPYVQRYIQVEGVDFKSLAKVGQDFDEADLERRLGEEKVLASLIVPLLDLVGDRRTLIFSPGVQMAKDVARFINARCPCKCSCGKTTWQAKKLIGDGAVCTCGRMAEANDIVTSIVQAHELDGSSHEEDRRTAYQDHQAGKFQFLSVCALCREGYNDPDIACVAVFRPVSKKASSLAEQMKGRACRPLRSLVPALGSAADAAERLKLIAESAKPHALIVDLVGITGLADCASTVQIYADGLVDELKAKPDIDPDAAEAEAEAIAARAAQILAEQSTTQAMPVEEAIEQAKRESEEAREKVRKEREAAEKRAREAAEKRAKAGAEVSYTQHEVGYGASVDIEEATEKEYNQARFWGMNIIVNRSRRKILDIVRDLRERLSFEEVARLNGLKKDDWSLAPMTKRQLDRMQREKLSIKKANTPREASLLISAKCDPERFVNDRLEDMRFCRTAARLSGICQDIWKVNGVLPQDKYSFLIDKRRETARRIGV